MAGQRFGLDLFSFAETGPQSFFIPTLTTLDERLLRTIPECPRRAVPMDDEAGRVRGCAFQKVSFVE